MAEQQHSSSAAASGRRASFHHDPDAIETKFADSSAGAPSSPRAHDPDAYIWRPVARRPRRDGWTPDRQRIFIEALAETGLVEQAAQAAGLSSSSAYRLRASDDGASFRAAWQVALAHAAERVLDLAFARAIHGEEVPVFDADGCRIATKWRRNDRLAMFILRAYMPDRFRDAHRSTRREGEPLPPPAPDLDDAIAALDPPAPADPAAAYAPEELAELYAEAELLADPGPGPERYVAPTRAPDHPRAVQRREDRREAAAARADAEAMRRARAAFADSRPLPVSEGWVRAGAPAPSSTAANPHPDPLLQGGGAEALSRRERVGCGLAPLSRCAEPRT